VRAALAGIVLAAASAVRAEPAPATELAALAPAPDVRKVIALGPHGELYEPDGKGAWLRHHTSTLAGYVIAATRGASAIAATRDGVAFRLANDTWTVVGLGANGPVIVGAGPRPLAASGRTMYALDRTPPVKLGDAPAPVVALAASATGIVIETDAGLSRLAGSAWKPITGAPLHVAALLSDRFALVDGGLLELATGKTIAWPSGLHVELAIASGDGVVAAAMRGTALELVTLHAGKLTSEPVPLDPPAPIVALAADRDGGVVLATRDGRLVVRDRGAWSATVVRDELPPSRPGPPPALSK